MKENGPDEPRVSAGRMLGTLGAMLSFGLAVAMGIQTFHAWHSDSPLSNWKNGTMRYRDGCQLAFTFACMGAAWLYFGFRTWSRRCDNDSKRTDAERGGGHVR